MNPPDEVKRRIKRLRNAARRELKEAAEYEAQGAGTLALAAKMAAQQFTAQADALLENRP